MNPNRPVPRRSVMAIEAYVPGKSGAPGAAKVYKLSSNETPLGPSPKAVAAFREAAGSLELYPDGSVVRPQTPAQPDASAPAEARPRGGPGQGQGRRGEGQGRPQPQGGAAAAAR